MVYDTESINGILNNLGELVSLIRTSPKKFAIFFGAGAGASAGLPLGNSLRDIILQEIYGFSLSPQELKEKFYDKFPQAKEYQELTLEVVNHFLIQKHGITILDKLKRELNKYKSPSIGYLDLKELCKKGFLNKIITVNFDELLEKALKELNPKVIGINSDIDKNIRIWENNKEPIILKLHGTISQPSNLRASLENVEKFPENKAIHLKYVFENHSVIFVGYNGRDQDVISIVKEIIKANEEYNYKFYSVSPSIKATQNQLLKMTGSETNFLKLKSDGFLNRLKGMLLGEAMLNSPMHEELKRQGYGVKRVLWIPGNYPYGGDCIDTVEVLIYQPNAIPDEGPIVGNVGEDVHKIVIELSKKYYPESKFWFTSIYSNRKNPKCKRFCTSIPLYNYGGATMGEMLPQHLIKYI